MTPGERGALLFVVACIVAGGCKRNVAVETTAPAAGPKPLAVRNPSPRRLPTISNIEWSAFPDPARHPAGRGGKTITISPGKEGVISAALQAAKPGDTILLRPGTYREGAEDDFRALHMDKERIFLRASTGRARILPRKGINYGLAISASHVRVEGLVLEGFNQAAISIGKEGATISDVILSDIQVKVPADGEWHDGITAEADLRKAGKPAVDGLLIRDVTVKGASLGISCSSGPCHSWWLENVSVVGPRGGGWGADGIAVENGRNLVLVNVEVSETAGDGIDLKARDVLLVGCRVHHVKRNGIKLWHGGDVMNSIVHHTYAEPALVFSEAGRYRLLNSLVAYSCHGDKKCYSLTAGYDTRKPQKVELVNSIFFRTYGAVFLADRTDARVSHCLFHDSKNGQLLRAMARGKEHQFKEGDSPGALAKAGLGAGNIFARPRFVAPKGGDFRPGSDSPIIDAGERIAGLPPKDLAGQPRIIGRAPEIGPFEVSARTAPPSRGSGCTLAE